ncbi:MAG: Na/Pi cotransporter family protein [Luteibaculaceae bacterium]
MDYGLFNIIFLVGALSIFIYGMKVMSEGIQRFAGGQLQRILAAMTANRVAGITTGFVTTSLIQSSSATTVMIVSFVNAGLLNLRQAITVIMGANIGTTVTAVIIAFFGFSKINLMNFALVVAALALPLMFSSKSKTKSFSDFTMGFAFILLGLLFLKSVVPEFSPNALEFLESLASYGFFSVILFIVIGTVLTIVLQSSTAAITLTLALCEKGIIDFPMAMAIILGENIGTTISANIAATIGNVNAKRAARAHLVFNVIGVIWVLPLFGFFTSVISNYLAGTAVGSPLENDSAIKWGLMLFHVVFNVTNTAILMWFIPQIMVLVSKMVPSKADEAPNTLEFISSGIMGTAELSLFEAKKELHRFSKIVQKMHVFVQRLGTNLEVKEFDLTLQKIERYEEITDKIELEITNYLSKVSEGELSDYASFRVRKMISIASDLEKIADVLYAIARIYNRKHNDKIWFTPEQRANVNQMFKLVEKAITIMVKNLSDEPDKKTLQDSSGLESQINALRDHLRADYLEKVELGEMNIRAGLVYNNIFSYCEEIGDKVFKIVETNFSELEKSK